MNPALTRKLTLLGLALMPALGVGAARWIAPNTAPRGATAAPSESSVPDLSLPALPVINPESELPMAISAAQASVPSASPLQYFNDQPKVESTGPAPQADPDPTFTLTSIVRSRENMAVINGKLRRVGDEVLPGWKVVVIDPAAGAVDLSRGQRSIRLQLRNPTEPR